jgi:hypothetical protein
MDYESFLGGLVDELEKAAKLPHGSSDEAPKKKEPKEEKKEEPEDPTPGAPEVEEQPKEALSSLEEAFFAGLYDVLEKQAGWRDLGAGRIAKMKERMATGLKTVRGKALKSLKETGQTGTKLYSVGKARGGHGKFYEASGGKGFKERRRKPFAERREGAGFKKRVQQAIQGRQMPGKGIGERMKEWGAGIRKKITGAAQGVGGAAKAVGQQAKGVGGAVTGAAKGAVQGAATGAAEGRQAAMAPKPKTRIRTISERIPTRGGVARRNLRQAMPEPVSEAA